MRNGTSYSRRVGLVFCLVSLPLLVSAQSWLSCPKSFNPTLPRVGVTNQTCEDDNGSAPVTFVNAGDRLKVGWPSNNQATSSNKPASATINARIVMLLGGVSIHVTGDLVVNGKRLRMMPNVLTQPSLSLTTLQTASQIGTDATNTYYSCAKLSVAGGNPSLTCEKPNRIPGQSCKEATTDGPSVDTFLSGAIAGAFCYKPDATGDIDDDISAVPVNAACDPRVSCSLSVNAGLCNRELTGISDPTNPQQVCATDEFSQLISSLSTSNTSNLPSCLPPIARDRPEQFCAQFTQSCNSILCVGFKFS
ncbi:hypothetical protein HK102_001907 [Quaeritorhiza haematococci]|nr:hypothetical protein HK102_001907 [Quaeritorhiza haematococci]